MLVEPITNQTEWTTTTKSGIKWCFIAYIAYRDIMAQRPNQTSIFDRGNEYQTFTWRRNRVASLWQSRMKFILIREKQESTISRTCFTSIATLFSPTPLSSTSTSRFEACTALLAVESARRKALALPMWKWVVEPSVKACKEDCCTESKICHN